MLRYVQKNFNVITHCDVKQIANTYEKKQMRNFCHWFTSDITGVYKLKGSHSQTYSPTKCTVFDFCQFYIAKGVGDGFAYQDVKCVEDYLLIEAVANHITCLVIIEGLF